MNITKITIGRLYNLGSYEHVRYELTAEIRDIDKPAIAMLGMERILAALNPKTSTHSRTELEREKIQLARMRERLSDLDEFRRWHGNDFVGTPEEYVERCEQSHAENVAKREKWEARSDKARKMLEDLGGAARWKDAKLDWECGDFDF